VIATDPRDPQQTKTLQRTFQFDVAIEGIPAAQFGGRVHVRFAQGTEPLGFQIYRRLRQLMLSRFNA
jgi:putative peptide zinc metalloprotease protein